MKTDRNDCALLREARSCSQCPDLPLGPRPILQWAPQARILIAGQAPGRITHEKGIPFDDPSGDRLREWLGVSRAQFYDPALFAIVPMGFCFPGTGTRGDLPPRPECAPRWRTQLLDGLSALELTIIIGRYAIDWHLGRSKDKLTEIVSEWRDQLPDHIVLPHPSPRNRMWLSRNAWFEDELLPRLRMRIAEIIGAISPSIDDRM